MKNKKIEVYKGFLRNGVVLEDDEYNFQYQKLSSNTNNKNDKLIILNDLQETHNLKDFKFQGVEDFQRIGYFKIEPFEIDFTNQQIRLEKIFIEGFETVRQQNLYKNICGVMYMITFKEHNKSDEKIVKFGQTRTTMLDRIRSYNCGSLSNFRTASTTNLKIKQSIVSLRNKGEFILYIHPCGNEEEIVTWCGYETKVPNNLSIAYEEIILKAYFEQFKTKPLGNVQSKRK